MRAWPRTGRKQHLACCPIAEQMLMKSAVEVGRVGGFAQFKSASPRTSVAQHCALLSVPGQSVTSRFSARWAGVARAVDAPIRAKAMIVENFIMKDFEF